MLVSRTFVIEAVLQTTDLAFDPHSMQPNQPSAVRDSSTSTQSSNLYPDGDWGNAADPYRKGTILKLITPISQSSNIGRRTDDPRMKAAGMHLTPTPAYFLVKIKQLHRALSLDDSNSNASILDCLDVHASDNPRQKVGSDLLLERPDSVTIQVSEPEYITDGGIEAIDVEIYHGDPDGVGKTVCRPFV